MKRLHEQIAQRILLSSFILLCYFTSFSANYYVSNVGNDSNSGLSPDRPWKSLMKVNAALLKSGDAVLFRKGDTFLGSLISPGSYLTFGAYGTGAKPIISGFKTMTGWVSQGNGIYTAPTTASANCNMVTINGVSTPVGRYPKTGWLTFESFTGRTSITDNQLTNTPNWTGAEVVIKKNDYTIDRSKITKHTASTITYSSGSTYNPTQSGEYNYFIQNSLNALTQVGDWYCNGTNLYMYFGANDPNSYVVKVSVVDKTILANSRNTNIFQDLAIEGSNVNGAYFYLSVNIQFKNCDFNNHGALGISGGGSYTIVIDACNISNCNGKGIDVHAAGTVIKNCSINNISMIPGMGEANGASYLGIKLGSVGGIIEYNELKNCGYIPISFSGNNSKIRYNLVDGFCSLITYGAGIYTYSITSIPANTGLEVYGNVVMNGGSNGLYSDGVANHVSFHDNTILNMAKNGIHMITPNSNNVSNNIFYNCSSSGISLENTYNPEANTVAANNIISNNTVVQGVISQGLVSLVDGKTYTIGNFGTSNYNVFLVAAEGLNLFKTQVTQPKLLINSYHFSNWKIFSKQESNSIQKVTDLSKIRLEYNASKAVRTIAISTPMVDAKGTKYSGSITLQPYTSVILIKDQNVQINTNSYYVSSNGNDANSGLSPDTPWKTLTKVNSASLKSGYSVLFRRGDTFFGTLISPGSYITYGAYGSGSKPVISGFQTVTGWVSQGNGIYAASTTVTTNCNMVTVNGVNTPMGRYPKTGWLSFESFVGRTSITDTQLTNTPNWTGAEVVIKKNNWTIDRSIITNHTNNTITYSSASTYDPVSVYGSYSYFIQKSPNSLTQLGDWFCNGTKLYMYFGANNPNDYTIKASVVDKLIDVNSKNTNIFQDLAIEGSNVNGAYFYLSVNIQFKNCDFNNHGAGGISGGGSRSIIVDNCNINDCNAKGIDINAVGSVIRNCDINNIFMNPGMGNVNGATHLGIKLGSVGGIIEYNELKNCGYIPVSFSGNNSKIRYNLVDGFCNLITDGAGIYTHDISSIPASIGLEVYNNIVLNGGANGLYSDGVSNHISFHDNTIFNLAKNGIHMNTPLSNNVSNNTIYNCAWSGISLQNLLGPEANTIAANNMISNNIVAQGNNNQRIMYLADAKIYRIGTFGVSDNNKFIVESSELNLFNSLWVQPKYASIYYNLTNWKTFSGQEKNSTLITADLSEIRFEYNSSKLPKTISLNAPMIDAMGTKYSTSITLQPYTSVLLINDLNLKSGSIPIEMNLKSTSIPSLSNQATMEVFPNPSKGRITVRFPQIPITGSRIDILDLSGRKVSSRIIDGTSEEFNLGRQSAGVYLVKSTLGKEYIVQKLIINK